MTTTNILTGQMTTGNFVAAMFLCLIGFMIQKKLSYNKSVKKSTMPKKFNWGYWFQNNASDMFYQLIISYVLVRFAPDVVTFIYPDSAALFARMDAMLIYLVLGFFSTRIGNIIRKRTQK